MCAFFHWGKVNEIAMAMQIAGTIIGVEIQGLAFHLNQTEHYEQAHCDVVILSYVFFLFLRKLFQT
jgi:hypothetical protein